MANHVVNTFGKHVKEYTLFHNPSDGGTWDTYESFLDKTGRTTGVTKEFSKALSCVQSSNSAVSWVAHSQGGTIFTQAVKYHLDNGGGKLDKNSVQFNGGANNQNHTNQILSQAGVKVLKFNNHPYDIVPQIIGWNHGGSISKIVGSIVHVPLLASQRLSPHTLPYTDMKSYLNKMPGWYKVLYKIF